MKYLNGKKGHRGVMQEFVGRKLERGEVVHHVDGDKSNNKIENLRIMTDQAHCELHNKKHQYIKKCLVCGCDYAPRPTKREVSKTCSKRCRYIQTSRTNRRPGLPHSMYRDEAPPSMAKNRKEASW